MTTSVIDQIGGEQSVRALVERFYDIIETDPDGADILQLHFQGHGLGHVREEQFNFLCGFFGGRNYFLEKHGHMNVKQIHAHVPIHDIDAENWLICMDRALADTNLDGESVEKIRATFQRVALSLVNQDD